MAGRGGTTCTTSEMNNCLHYNKAIHLFLTLPTNELNQLLKTVVHRSGAVTNWHRYLKSIGKRSYKEYLSSDEWKRKRAVAMNRAMMKGHNLWYKYLPENPVIVYARDKYGRVIKSIRTEPKPICEVNGCENQAEHVHHKNYDNVGKERLEDLLAVCKKCHGVHHHKI